MGALWSDLAEQGDFICLQKVMHLQLVGKLLQNNLPNVFKLVCFVMCLVKILDILKYGCIMVGIG